MRSLAAAGDGRDDGDLVRVLDRRLQVLEEADVLVVGEDVHEAPDLAALVADALLDPGELRFEAGDEITDGGARGRDLFLAVRQLAQRSGNPNRGHVSLLVRLRSKAASAAAHPAGRRSRSGAARSARGGAASPPADPASSVPGR